MSLAPNALNLQIEKGEGKPCHAAFIGRVGHLDAYDTDYFDKQCLERLQTFDYWEGEQFHDFANVVTRNCDGIFYNNRGGDRPWLKYQTLFSPPMWTFESGFIINIDSGKCVQIGGSMDQQCGGNNLKSKATLSEASENLRRASGPTIVHEWRDDTQHKHPYISASVAPALLFPCNRGCTPDDVMRWEAAPVNRTTTTTTSTAMTDRVVMLKLRTNLNLCLRSGVDSQHVSFWIQATETWVVLLVLSIPLLLAFRHERKYRISHYKLHLFGDSFGVGVLVLRLLCSSGALVQGKYNFFLICVYHMTSHMYVYIL
jgi:hypothetical protein